MIPIETGRNDYRARAHASGVSHRHRTADAIRASFVAGCKHHPASAWRPDKQWLASQGRIIKLLNRRVERIHIGMSNNPWPNPR